MIFDPLQQKIISTLECIALAGLGLLGLKEYAKWWSPMVEEIVIDKDKSKKQAYSQKAQKDYSKGLKDGDSPVVFLSYQWGKQPQIKALYQRLTSLGYTVWMDIYQMGGGDSLYDKIDRGMRACKAVVSCVTQKYSLSANCRREISLADALKKPIIPLLLEQMKWPPDGPMSMVFTELLFINFYRDEKAQMIWKGDKFDELLGKLHQFVPQTNTNSNNQSKEKIPAVTSNSTKTAQNGNVKATASNKEQLIEKKDTKDKNDKNKVMTAEGVNTTASSKEQTSKTQENIMEKKDGLDKTDRNKLMTAADKDKVARKDSGKNSSGSPAKTTTTKDKDEDQKSKQISVSGPDLLDVQKTSVNNQQKQGSYESGTVAKGVVNSDAGGQENDYSKKQRNDDSKQGTSKSCNIL